MMLFHFKHWPAMSERNESNGASRTPIELVPLFLSEFRRLLAKLAACIVKLIEPLGREPLKHRFFEYSSECSMLLQFREPMNGSDKRTSRQWQ